MIPQLAAVRVVVIVEVAHGLVPVVVVAVAVRLVARIVVVVGDHVRDRVHGRVPLHRAEHAPRVNDRRRHDIARSVTVTEIVSVTVNDSDHANVTESATAVPIGANDRAQADRLS